MMRYQKAIELLRRKGPLTHSQFVRELKRVKNTLDVAEIVRIGVQRGGTIDVQRMPRRQGYAGFILGEKVYRLATAKQT